MFSKNHPIILFIDRSGFSIFQDTLPNIVKFNFTADIVANLDVVNKEKFSNLIATFIQINKIISSSIAVVLSDTVIYIKDLANPLEAQKDTQDFLEDVPFEEILAKVIKTDNLNRIVAVNKDLVMTIINAFVNKGSNAEAVTPSFMYGENVNFTVGLTQDNIRIILENTETLRSGNLLTDQEKMIPPAGAKSDLANEEKKPQNISLYLLVGVFVTLLVILAVVYFNLGASKSPPASPKVKNSSVNTVSTPTIIQASQITITTTPVDLKSVKIKIVQNSGSEAIGNNLKNELLKIGFEDIVSETSGDTPSEKSSVIFSQNVPADLKNEMIIGIKKIFPEISILENQDINLTVTILIGKLN